MSGDGKIQILMISTIDFNNRYDCLKNFNKFNCISQSILVTQFTSKLLSYANINDKLVVEFSNFIIDENNI